MLLLAAPSWEKKDFSQWTADDAKKVLSDSPWAKTIHLNMGRLAMQTGDARDVASSSNLEPPSPASPISASNGGKQYLVSPDADGGPQMGGSAGGGRQTGGGAGQTQQPSTGGVPQSGTGQPGQAPQAGGTQPTAPQGTPVVLEWESAVPVRLAELKLKAGDSQPSQADVEQAKKPTDTYVIALVGVPGKPQEGEEKEMATAATITPKNKQAIQATSVKEQAMSGGTRALMFSFPKTQAITEDDKTVQFRIVKGTLPTEVKQNFKLKDMHYGGKLAL